MIELGPLTYSALDQLGLDSADVVVVVPAKQKVIAHMRYYFKWQKVTVTFYSLWGVCIEYGYKA